MAQRLRHRIEAEELISERLDHPRPSTFERTATGASGARETVRPTESGEATVLIVDLRPGAVRVLTAALLGQGYRVCAATDAAAACDALFTHHPEVAIVQVDLLAGDPDLVRRLRAHDPALPVVVCGPPRDAAGRRHLLRAHDVSGVYGEGDALERLFEHVDAALSARRCTERACMEHEARDLLLAKLCHDLRSPLAVVQGYTDLLQAGPVDSLLSEVLARLAGATEAAVGLVQEYLELAGLEAPSPDAGCVPLELDELVEDLQVMAMRQIGDRPLRLVVHVPWAGGILYADARRLRAILVHLISNTIRFSGAGNISLIVRGRRERTEFVVTGPGSGVADEPGAPLAAACRPEAPATNTSVQGIGLAVVKRLSALIGAVLTVNTRHAGGTVFRLRVPGKLTVPPAGVRGRTLH